MKILWLGHFVPWPLRGGSLIRSYHLLKEASRAGEVSFLGFFQRALHPTETDLEEARIALDLVCRRMRILPIPKERGPLVRARLIIRGLVGKSYDEAWLASKEMERAFAAEIEAFRPELIHVDTVGLAPYISLAPTTPAVLNHHNIESQMMARRALACRRSVERLILRWQARLLADFERRWVPRFQRNLVVSDLDGERLRERAPGVTVDVVPNGVDPDYFKAFRDPSTVIPRSTVFVGGLNWYPNRSAIEWFLRQVLPLIRQRFPDATITVIGKNPPDWVEGRIGTEPGVRFSGEVPDIRPLIARSAVFVCPMLEGGGTRLKILDALAMGIPLVATRLAVEGIPVTNGTEALLANDAGTFAEAVCSLFERPETGNAMALAGRALVESKFSWASIGERLRATYRSCVVTKGP